ncbi:MAG: hypothetical protein R3A47_08490 [Polyangiales bacterium]
MPRLVLWHRALPPLLQSNEYNVRSALWTRHVKKSIESVGGQVISAVAGTVVSVFEADAYRSAMSTAVTLLKRAEETAADDAPMNVAFGLALGDIDTSVESEDALVAGTAIDRAQWLANRAGPGEVLVDSHARRLAASSYVFQIRPNDDGSANATSSLERHGPTRTECRESIGQIAQMNPRQSMLNALAPLVAKTLRCETASFLLMGERCSDVWQALRKIRQEVHPPVYLELGAVPGKFEPLGSLRIAFSSLMPSDLTRVNALLNNDEESQRVISSLAKGGLPHRASVSIALTKLLTAGIESGRTLDRRSSTVFGRRNDFLRSF